MEIATDSNGFVNNVCARGAQAVRASEQLLKLQIESQTKLKLGLYGLSCVFVSIAALLVSNRHSGLYFGTAGGKFFTYYGNSSISGMASAASINDGKWHQVTWTSDGVTEKMFIDGSLDSGLSQTRAGGDTGAAYIGYDAPNGEYFNGDISEVAIYGDVAP